MKDELFEELKDSVQEGAVLLRENLPLSAIQKMKEEAETDLDICKSIGENTRLEQRAADVIKLADALITLKNK